MWREVYACHAVRFKFSQHGHVCYIRYKQTKSVTHELTSKVHCVAELHSTFEQPQAPVLLLQQGVQDVTVAVQVRPCRPGEVMGSQQNVCDPCPAGQYSFNISSVACHDACPDNANCPQGAVLVPVEGYWHSAADATFIHACPNQAACRYASAQQLLLLLLLTRLRLPLCKMLLLLGVVCL